MSKMMKSDKKALVPRLRFPEFRDAGDWKYALLGQLANRRTERNWDGKVVRVLTNSAEHGVVDQRDYFDKDIATQGNLENYFIVGKGDFVYNPRISAFAPVGPISRNRIAEGVMSPLYTVFRFKSCDTDFYTHYFKSSAWHFYMRQVGSTGARHDRMAISNDDFMSMPLPVPGSAEQQRIADCLTSIDVLIAVQSEKLDALKTHKKGLMQQLFPREGETAPRLRFPEFRDAGEWEEYQLNQIATPVSNKTHGKSNVNILTLSGEHGLVLQCEYFGKKIAGENVERYISIARNDFVYNDRTTKSSIYGSIKRLANYDDGIVSPIYKCFRFNAEENPVFWEWYFDSGSHESQLHALVNEGARAGRFNISIEKFLSTFVRVPSSIEQQKIADCFSSLDALIAAQSEKLDALKTHKKGLMQQLFPSAEAVEA